MFAPWPTKNELVTVLLVCLTAISKVSTATVVVTVYLPLTAVQVPRLSWLEEAPAASAPLNDPLMDLTVVPLVSLTTMVTACVPDPEAMVPWFLMIVLKLTVLPADGLLGDQLTVDGVRSELCTGCTTRLVGLV